MPIVVLLDGLPVGMEGKHALYAYDQVGLVKPLAKWVAEVPLPELMPEMLRKAFRIATSGRPGPVVLIPQGIADGPLASLAVLAPKTRRVRILPGLPALSSLLEIQLLPGCSTIMKKWRLGKSADRSSCPLLSRGDGG